MMTNGDWVVFMLGLAILLGGAGLVFLLSRKREPSYCKRGENHGSPEELTKWNTMLSRTLPICDSCYAKAWGAKEEKG